MLPKLKFLWIVFGTSDRFWILYLGASKFNAFISEIEAVTGQAIDDAVERELASAIDEAVAYAVQQGVSEAVAAAAIEAMIIVYALGGSDEDAMNACRSIAGDAC